MLVAELYLDAFRLEQSSLAHYLYHLLEDGKFQWRTILIA